MHANVVVIPVKDQVALTESLLGQLAGQPGTDAVYVLDNGSTDDTSLRVVRQPNTQVVDAAGLRLSEMWEHGVELARHAFGPRCNIAFLNNDIRLGPEFVVRLAARLRRRPDVWAVSPRYEGPPFCGIRLTTSTYKNGGMAGFAFMAKGEIFDEVRFDPDFEWWYGDDDFVAQIELHGGRVGIVGDTTVEHINGGSQTVRYSAEVRATIERDRARMRLKWQHL